MADGFDLLKSGSNVWHAAERRVVYDFERVEHEVEDWVRARPVLRATAHAILDVERRVMAVRRVVYLGIEYAPGAILRATGVALGEIVRGVLPALLLAVGILVATTLALAAVGIIGGAIVGAILGALAGLPEGGVGAIPGAIIGAGVGAEIGGELGAEAGYVLGLKLLEFLGLYFLVKYMTEAFVDGCTIMAQALVDAWRSVDTPSLQRVREDAAARKLARGAGRFFQGILQGVVAILLAKGMQNAAKQLPGLLKNLRASRLGAGFAEFVERNWQKLIDNPRLRGKPATSGGGAAGEHPDGAGREPQPSERLPTEDKGPTRPKPTRAERLQELAKDPAHGNRVTPKSMQEAEVALSMEESGQVRGPVTRDPSGAADFIDGDGQPWDVKGFNSNYPPEKGGFDLARDSGKVESEVASGENVMVDTTKMSPQDASALRADLDAKGLSDNVVWYP